MSLDAFSEKTKNKRINLEKITKKFLGEDFEISSIDSNPYIFLIYSGKILDNDWIAYVNIKRNIINLEKKRYFHSFLDLKEKYIKKTKEKWIINSRIS